jgi:hypothetical protein
MENKDKDKPLPPETKKKKHTERKVDQSRKSKRPKPLHGNITIVGQRPPKTLPETVSKKDTGKKDEK